VNGPNCRGSGCGLKYSDPVPSSRSPNPLSDAGGVRAGGVRPGGGPTFERGIAVGDGLILSAGNVGGCLFGEAGPCSPSGLFGAAESSRISGSCLG
jgi:hypothetical protein